MPSPAEFALLAGALFVASAVNALVGFGFALTSVPLMALAVGPRDAVVLSALMGMLSSGGVALRHREEVARPIASRLVAGSLVGMPIGLFVLAAVPERWIGIGIGVVVL
ncbi:MAG TPA: sulfite exporter TauE/SafE family protein, partial [Microthrixaceae bacterium]|nr:sulfite exporter TauE/SafE family protein [Microthrixaceae bacterium]